MQRVGVKPGEPHHRGVLFVSRRVLGADREEQKRSLPAVGRHRPLNLAADERVERCDGGNTHRMSQTTQSTVHDQRAESAVSRASAAFAGWARTSPARRAAAVAAAADDVREAAEELAELNVRETGKLAEDALGGVNAGA